MAVNNRRTPDDFHDPEVGAGHHVAPSKSVVTKVLDAVTAGGNTLVSLLSGLLAAAMILYSGFVLYDTFYTQNAAYSSGLDLLQYKPEIIEEGLTPTSGAETLAAVNNEYRAWLTLYDTNIDYPVMQHDNDLYYASHDVYGKTSLTGAIYLAARNSADLSDSYNLIYGHHMDNGAMFGALDAYLAADYRNGHREGMLVGSSGVFDLRVFAVVDTDAYESAIYTVGDRMDEVIAFLRDPGDTTTVRYFDSAALEGAEKIVALSTCAAANTNGRLVVFATMTRRPMITVSAVGYTGMYDARPHELESVTPSITAGTTVSYSTDDGMTWSTARPTRTGAGTAHVLIKVSNDYYGEATTEAEITVAPAPVTVTANDASKTYGTGDPNFAATVSGLLDDYAIVYTVSRPGAGTDEDAGLYSDAVVPTGDAVQGNYVVTYVPANFVIIRNPGGPVTNPTDEGGNGDDDNGGGNGGGDGGEEEILDDINDFRTPLANFINSFNPTIGPATPAWALVNLISLILTVYLLFPLLHLGDKFGRVRLMRSVNIAKEELREAEELFDEQQLEKLRIERQAVIDKARAAGLDEEAAIREAEARGFVEVTEDEFSTAVEYLYYKVKKFLRRFRTGIVLEFIDAAVALIVFMLTEDMRLPMILIDKWTPLMILFLAFCWVTDVRLARYREKVLADEEEETREQEAAVSAATAG